MKFFFPFALTHLFTAASASSDAETRALFDQSGGKNIVIPANERSDEGDAFTLPAELAPIASGSGGKANLRGRKAAPSGFTGSNYIYDVKQHPSSSSSIKTNALVGDQDHVFMTNLHPTNQEGSISVSKSTQGGDDRERSLGGLPTSSSLSGCLDTRFQLDTGDDGASLALLIFDYDMVLPDATLSEAVLSVDFGELDSNSSYGFTEQVCLDPTKCYGVILWDSKGDGFSSDGGFYMETIDENGNREVIMDIKPGNTGTVCEGCETAGTTYFFFDFGSCFTSTTEGCLNFEMSFIADSPDQYAFILYDLADTNIENPRLFLDEFEVGVMYSTDSPICLDPNVCWIFSLIDFGLDGIVDSGGLVLYLNGEVAYVIETGNNDFTGFAADGSFGHWSVSFGTCSGASPTPSPTPAPATGATSTCAGKIGESCDDAVAAPSPSAAPAPVPEPAPGPSPSCSGPGVAAPGHVCYGDFICCSGDCKILNMWGQGECQ